MPSQIPFDYMDLYLFYETSLVHIRIIINKIMEQNSVKEDHTIKKILDGETVYYNEETPFCLISETTVFNLETMDVMYSLIT